MQDYEQNDNSDDDNDVTILKFKKSNDEFDFLYPDLNDPHFNIKIAKKKEFNDTQYDGKITDVKKQSDVLCNIDFELMPHQLFVRNFLSLQTPYNSLFLYHGLGSVRTCTAIGISEEMRVFMKDAGLTSENQRILVIATPIGLQKFQLELFDDSKLKIDTFGKWNIQSCVGNSILNEVNPPALKGLTRQEIVSNIKRIIADSYQFFDYIEFARFAEKKDAKQFFSNRLLIIDEVHNIYFNGKSNQNNIVSKVLFHIVKESDNLRK